MKNKIIINTTLLIFTYVLPLYIFSKYQDDYLHIDSIQKWVFVILFFGSTLITYLNHKNQVQVEKFKTLWVSLQILGVLGIIYSVTALYLIFAFRKGIGF